MNTDELIAALRMTAFIGDAALFPDYDDARLRTELTDALHTAFARAIVASRQGYWLRRDYYDHLAGTPAKRIPARAIAVEQVAIAPTSTNFGAATAAPSRTSRYTKLEEVSETHAQEYEGVSGAVGEPQKYVIRGDMIWLLPTQAADTSVRITYYLRPSRLVEPQSDGLITALGAQPESIMVDTLPVDMDTALPIADASVIDVVHSDGWHAPFVLNSTIIIWDSGPSGTGPYTLLFSTPGNDDMREIRPGEDYVRVANQSEWPPLPDDFHRPLAETAAIKVMQQLNMSQKAGAQKSLTDADVQRFYDLIQPRVKAEARAAKAPRSVLQVGRGSRRWR